jgi:hypothetical protein
MGAAGVMLRIGLLVVYLLPVTAAAGERSESRWRIKVTTLESQLIHLIQELSGRTLKKTRQARSDI